MSDLPAGPRARRPLVVAVAALVSSAALAGCSSAKPAAGAHGGATTTTSGSPPATTTTSPAASTTSTAAGNCTGSITVSLIGSEGAAGTIEDSFALHNTASTGCPLTGYPEIQLLGAGGTTLPTTSVHGGGASFTDFPVAAVNLFGGQTAYVNVGYSDVPTGSESTCPTATALKMTLPGATTARTVPGQFSVCNGGTVNVSPVFGPGSPQTQTTAPPPPGKVAPAS